MTAIVVIENYHQLHSAVLLLVIYASPLGIDSAGLYRIFLR